MAKSITSANAVFLLSILDLYPTAQQLQGFAADDVFGTDPLASAEAIMGVDGHLSGGYVNVPVIQAITLQADSDSNLIFDNWFLRNKVQTETFEANATVILPALRQRWILTRGFLTSYMPIPDVKRTLQPRRQGITWESVLPAPF